MDQLSYDLIIFIYSYNTINDIKYINKFAHYESFRKYKKASPIIYNIISNYINDYKYITSFATEDDYNNKLIWKRYYPLRFRQSIIELSLTKLQFTSYQKYNKIKNLITKDKSKININFIEFINILSLDELLYIGW